MNSIVSNKKHVILDTDTYNECDDQFAIAYLLKSQDVYDIEAITIAPFKNRRISTEDYGIELSYIETQKIFELCKENYINKIFKGSTNYITNGYHNRNEAVDKIIEIALKNERTYILCIGALTNIALAIQYEPKIIGKIEVVWLGGNTLLQSSNKGTNFKDLDAVKIVFESKAKLTIIPCIGVASNLKTSIYELSYYIKDKNDLCNFLYNRFAEISDYYVDENFNRKTLWDISVIAYFINPNWFHCFSVSCPFISTDTKYQLTKDRHKVTFVSSINDNSIFHDLFGKLVK
ncbi:MAG: nucleoside hydrolase [Erysipelotrichales bacterium]|nr:nucleoside hydrolase [Erysipelotrichales bacterium]